MNCFGKCLLLYGAIVVSGCFPLAPVKQEQALPHISCAEAEQVANDGMDASYENEFERAYALLDQACNCSVVGACLNAGNAALSLEKPEAAIARYEKSCLLSNAAGCRGVADFSNIPAVRREHFEKACRLGDALSCRSAAELHKTAERTVWLERGCIGGDGLACLF